MSGWDEVHNCGSVCCAIGWLPAFDKTGSVVWDTEGKDIELKGFPEYCYYHVAEHYFGLNDIDAEIIFSPYMQEHLVGFSPKDNLPGQATPKQVADLIRKYVEINS